ncbi:LOW QUALITY PROTEIN: melanopsin-B [Salmo salar]|uniref:LOW QUALITY PROTEIN: melanopsin-B n=1 Tax=Salmo salar TaxID=8030 RepID=A0ABM3ECL5_SALSA|nr:LOW QUALITY PROTEIN: opsin 9 [Salmo salar]
MSLGVNGSWRGSVPSSIPTAFLSHLSPSTDLGVAIFLILTGVVSVVGNGIVLLVFCRKKKKLRPPELMTVNLAICDFGYSLLGAPCLIISSVSHGWVFGEAGCLWYGLQGFVFGIGSLITTCLISLDRCLKICSFRYGQWIERRHMSMSIGLVWFYSLFWASLPVFGSYGPEPFGTSCTINWWGMRSSLIDRVYILLILIMCFFLPTLTIVASYVTILLTVYRSSRVLASIPSSTFTHTSKDLRLTKIAAVVCSTFLLSWTPYAIVSLYSALAPKEEHGAGEAMQGGGPSMGTGGSTGMASAFPHPQHYGLLNWTSTENYGSVYYDPGESLRDVTNPDPYSYSGLGHSLSAASTRSSAPGQEGESETGSNWPVSCLPPMLSLIPAMFAKSHCMINPFIYQIMNKDFREDVYDILFGRQNGERRRMRGRGGSYSDTPKGSLSYCHSWRGRSKPKAVPMVELGKKERAGDTISEGWDALGVASLDTQVNMDGQSLSEAGRETERELGGSTSSSLLTE